MLDDIDVGALGVGIANVIRHVERNVRHGVREVEEEGLFFIRLNELNRFVGVAAGDGALIDGELDDFLILHEGSFPVREGGLGIGPKCVHAHVTTLWLPLVVGVVHVI